ncbi:protein of unknown function [Thermomonospora echinospora]|uniref:DUF4913 domain-containing protein n=1 Tax=Thermomonospora echinospora TaxID=1992 RepID=A0A1H5UT79_9ACTN|nr:DUF4913 domain-containing protein [Thermomonospora echinospora]SEF78332.1 protein of unknown function [Thermomonospora echinospora]
MTLDDTSIETAEELPEPFFPDVITWVTHHFVPVYRRTLGGEFRWCAQWWRHAEAISRLTALWHSWETMRLQPGIGISLWYRDHLDHQLPVLLGPRGPFYQCNETEHLEPHQAAVVPVPMEFWEYGVLSTEEP